MESKRSPNSLRDVEDEALVKAAAAVLRDVPAGQSPPGGRLLLAQARRRMERTTQRGPSVGGGGN